MRTMMALIATVIGSERLSMSCSHVQLSLILVPLLIELIHVAIVFTNVSLSPSVVGSCRRVEERSATRTRICIASGSQCNPGRQ